MKIGFLGAGNMAAALTRGILANNLLDTDQIRAADISENARHKFEAQTGISPVSRGIDMIDEIDVLIIAVKPQIAQEAVSGLTDQCKDKLIVSIAAGIRLKKICNWFNHERVIRIMPNTPAMIRKGAAAFACGKEVNKQDKELVRNILEGVGIAFELEESQLDTVTALSGSGPAYVFEFTQALIDGAKAQGLADEIASRLAVQTLAGAAEMLLREKETPQQLRDAVTSPGGTTEAGLKVMQEHKINEIMNEVIAAAKKRAVELSA